MPFFSIYEPLSGPPHYFTITLIGLQRGLVVRWSPKTTGWLPQVVSLKRVTAFNGARLVGYHLVPPEEVDAQALDAMTGKKQSWP